MSGERIIACRMRAARDRRDRLAEIERRAAAKADDDARLLAARDLRRGVGLSDGWIALEGIEDGERRAGLAQLRRGLVDEPGRLQAWIGDEQRVRLVFAGGERADLLPRPDSGCDARNARKFVDAHL